ncbi:type VI secretion system-associated protein TagF [Rhodovastum atsumiense]|uniref:Type VI secretion system-associated protein TagF n=1 Tax=Rhodovastum atsumiense TaxID=504468 RepID=A0A5M6IWQ3_9PROT|nr:type VI secretion system-associated protein TagF [Rhodovastum atsumiense]KAA5612722.1 type VI secretion system-associated protein TagF [Rhodovastum atsumiense]
MSRAGFFGKLPARGDFVRGGLSRKTVAAWDGWVQSVLPAARAAIGPEGWDAIWRAAPCWRLALPAALAGGTPFSGVWLPSTDAVGRAFPLLAGAEAGAPEDAFLAAIEASCRAAIEGCEEPAALAARLAALAVPPPAEAAPGRWWRGGDAAFTPAAMPDAALFLRMLTEAS